MIKGEVISGEFSRILAREKSDQAIELGELLIAESGNEKILLQVFDLVYGSQISQQNLELISGMRIEEGADFSLFDANLRNYMLALLKNLVVIRQGRSYACKSPPKVFSPLRPVSSDDLPFLSKPKSPLFIGRLRSGSKVLDVPIFLDGRKVFSHHILIPGTTGRGKSVLMGNMLWDTLDRDYCGLLVLDPHDEYYGRNKAGLKDHPEKACLVYYTPNDPPPGTMTLKINIRQIKPGHFNGVVYWTQAQQEALISYHKRFKDTWIEKIIFEEQVPGFQEGTVAVIKRRLLSLLSLETDGENIYPRGIFDFQAGESTIADIVKELEAARTVIIDTSCFSGAVEILVGSLITTEIFSKYKAYAYSGSLKEKPCISIVLEEAPRVLGREVLEKGPNIFSTIAREGRKFRVGLTAITQLPSLIPREILANINTKIILGTEMKPERTAIIESAAQDLSDDDRNIASLDRGEAVITSNFSPFAIPVKIPLIDRTGSGIKKPALDLGGINIDE